MDNDLTEFYRRGVRVRDELAKIQQDHKHMAPGWYASGAGVRTGPHKTKSAAREAMRLAPRARAEQRLKHGTDYPYPIDMHVWEEF